MTGKPDAWMPLYVADWDAGTGHLDCEQDGAYGRLVRWYWRNGPPADDDGQLARIVRMPLARWRKVRPVVVSFFVIVEGRWTHRRVDQELANAVTRKERFSTRGKGAAAARWGKKGDATSMQDALLEQCPPPSQFVAEGSNKPSAHKRRPSGRAPGEARPSAVWSGPPELREAIVADPRLGEGWALTWLDPCGWQDVPARGLLPKTRTAAGRIAQQAGRILAEFGVVIISEAA